MEPSKKSDQALDPPPAQSAAKQSPGLRILIAEDVKDCADALAVLLRMYGHEVMISPDGIAAVQFAQTQQPDVLLLDIGLPKLNGYEVAKTMRKLNWRKRPLIVAVTGYGQEEHLRLSREAGIDHHLTKPLDPEQLRSILDDLQKKVV
jgi:CheY-like chemotaxis protein